MLIKYLFFFKSLLHIYQRIPSEIKLLSKANLPVLNDVGALGVVHVAAGVVVCVPLAAPGTGHTRHAPETPVEKQSPAVK